MATQAQTQRIIRIIAKADSKQLEQLANTFRRLDKQVTKTAKHVQFAGTMFQGWIGLQTIQWITDASDAFQKLNDRITVFTGSTEKAKETLLDLTKIAAYTKTATSALAQTYNRIALATSDLGISSKAVLGLTTALQQSFRLSGATIAEAAAASIQLSQALSSGQLRGQELRSVLEQNAIMGDMLAKHFGVARGQLLKLGESGKITSDQVLKMLANNFARLDKDAAKLGQTFSETLIIASDKLKFKIHEVNQAMGLNSLFARAVSAMTDNMHVLGIALSATAAVMITKLVPALFAAAKAGWAFMASLGPLGLAAAAVGAAIGLVIHYCNDLRGAFEHIKNLIKELIAKFKVFRSEVTLENFSAKKNKGGDQLNKTLKNYQTQLEKNKKELLAIQKINKGKSLGDFFGEKKTETKDAFNVKDFENALKQAAGDLKTPLKKTTKELMSLKEANDQFYWSTLDTTRALMDYDDYIATMSMDKLNKDFREGKIDVYNYAQAMNKLTQTFSAEGALTVGIHNYMENVGSLTSAVAQSISNTFNSLENLIVDFVKKGKLEFSDFANAVVADLAKIAVQQSITAPLAASFKNLDLASFFQFGQGGGGASSTTMLSQSSQFLRSAHGNAFDGGLEKFATGGIVSRPTTFGYGNNKRGLMGEAGPEAVMPLKRLSNGDLGVQAQSVAPVVNVNVVNSSASTEATVSEHTDGNGQRVIDILIEDKVKNMFRYGKMDRMLNGMYGLSRRGV